MDTPMDTTDNIQAQMQAQNQLLAAQNELLIQQLGEQRAALENLRRENSLMMNPGSQLSSFLSTTIQSTIEQTLKVSSMSKSGGRPLEVPSYDGTLGMPWKNFKNKLLNELNRPNSCYANMKYSFMYSKASGDFLKYLDSTNFESEDFDVIITRLDDVFRGTNPRLDAIRKLEELVVKGTTLGGLRDYYYTFRSFQIETGYTAKDLFQKYMDGFVTRNKIFIKANFANDTINYKEKLEELNPTDFKTLSVYQEELLKYVEEYLIATSSLSDSGLERSIKISDIKTPAKDFMDLSALDLSDPKVVSTRLKFLCTKNERGTYPPVHGHSQEKRMDRKLLEKYNIYFGCRRSYNPPLQYQKHKENCTLGCNLKSGTSAIMLMDLASLGIASASDSEYDSLRSDFIVNKPSGSEVKSCSEVNQNVKNKSFSELSHICKPDLIPIPSSVVDRFSFTMFCSEISSNVSVLIDTGAVLNVISFEFAKLHNLTLQQGKEIKVKFGNGSTARSSHCTILSIKQGSYVQKIEFFVADIHLPMILGMPWISAVVITKIDWLNKAVHFHDRQEHHCLIADSKDKDIAHSLLLSSIEFESAITEGEFESWGILSLTDVASNSKFPPKTDTFKSSKSETSRELSALLKEYADIFVKPTQPPPSRPEDHEIKIIPGSKLPAVRGIGRLNDGKLKILKDTLNDLLEKGFIQSSLSPFGTNILFAKKPDGSLRLCVDYRGLNSITVKNKAPLPNLGELRDRVSTARFFSTMDLRDGFYNILVKKEDRHKTAFRTRYGHYEFVVLPMGLTNSPATMQTMMNRIFGEFYDLWLLGYLDDLLVYTKDISTHLNSLKTVFNLLRKHKLFLKLEKCTFLADSVRFCGHVLSSNGISLNIAKLPGINREAPRSPKEVQQFLGLVNWFREFIPQCAEISQPLSHLTRKDTPWKWGAKEQTAFLSLLRCLHSAPTLKHYESEQQTYLYTDASDYAIGGWIGQYDCDRKLRPIVYYSRKMTAHELKYPVHEKELLAIIAMLDHHGAYLASGAICRTDHKPLVWLQSQPILSGRQVRWVLKLQEFNLQIEYLPGKLNSVADYLSRQPSLSPKCHSCQARIPNYDPESNHIECLTIENDQLVSIAVVDLAGEPKAQQHVLSNFHDRAHQGINRTLKSLRRYYTWPSMKKSVKEYVETCDACQRSKVRNSKAEGQLQSLPIPSRRFSVIGLDWFFLPAASTKEDCVMIIVDYLTKFVKLIPCKSTSDSSTMASLFKLHWHDQGFGLPSMIVSDRDSKLTSKFWQKLCLILNIQRNLATARHQQTNGQVERTIRTVKQMLIANDVHSNWLSTLSSVEYAINDSISQSTGYTPFFLTFGQHPESFTLSPELKEIVPDWSKSTTEAQKAIKKAQDHQAAVYNLNRKASSIAVNDLVLLERDGINWSPDSQLSKKLLSPWLGPFRVLAVDGLNATLELPPTSKLHNVFSVNKLKRYNSGPGIPPSPDLIDGQFEWEVSKILDHRQWQWRKHLQYLVEFKGLHKDTKQWLFAADLNHCQEAIEDYLLTKGGVADPAVKVKDKNAEVKGKIRKLKLRLTQT